MADTWLDQLLALAVKMGASDLHLSVGSPPLVRLRKTLVPVAEGAGPLDANGVRQIVAPLLEGVHGARLEEELSIDRSYESNGRRFRVNVFHARGNLSAVMRVIPAEIPPFSALGLPANIEELARLNRGLVLVTGPTGSGKSTTLASLVDSINTERAVHLLTIEDPVEFLHKPKKALINQREIGADARSFPEALRAALREDPDVILVGEARDLETMQVMLSAAETGHLVFATLHTQSASETITRLVDSFPADSKDEVRAQLAGSLKAVVAQQMLESADGQGRVVAAELLICDAAAKAMIRESKQHQLTSHIATNSRTQGMMTMDQSLAVLVRRQRITEETAFAHCRDRESLKNLLAAA